MRIFLIGFMGCGKTTLGKKLAKHLNFNFIDLDRFIENKTVKSINVIFDEKEEQYFRDLEKESLNEIYKMDNLVIATGGGTPCFSDNMQTMLEKGICIYLKMEAEDLAERLGKEKNNRPLICHLTKNELNDFISEKLMEREKFYKKAYYILPAKNISKSDVIKLIS
jgi:shikimate kinase